MKTKSESSWAGKVTSWSIIGVVLAGTLLISGIAEISEGTGMMAKIFLLFVGAVIVVQVIPGVMLLYAMVKGAYGLLDKKDKSAVGASKK